MDRAADHATADSKIRAEHCVGDRIRMDLGFAVTFRKLVLAHTRQRLRIRREQYRAHARHGRHRRDLHRAFGRQLVLHAARPVPATRFGLRHHDYDSRADFRARVPQIYEVVFGFGYLIRI